MISSGARSIARLLRDHAPQLSLGNVQPHAALTRVSKRNVEWARRLGLVSDDLAAQRLAAIRCGSFAAHTYPTADEELVQLGADLISWLYLFDDLYGEGRPGDDVETLRERFSIFEATLRGGMLPEPPCPFHRALLDLRARVLACLNDGANDGSDDTWIDRFADAMAAYFHGCELEHPHRVAGVPPEPNEYRRVRSLSIGASPVFALIELQTGRLSREERESPQLRELCKTGALLCAWVNDIYSYPKERVEGEPMNLVATLAHHYSLVPDEALGAAVQVFRTDAAMFEALHDALEYRPVSATVRDYARGVRRWVRGNAAWTGLCGRYYPIDFVSTREQAIACIEGYRRGGG